MRCAKLKYFILAVYLGLDKCIDLKAIENTLNSTSNTKKLTNSTFNWSLKYSFKLKKLIVFEMLLVLTLLSGVISSIHNSGFGYAGYAILAKWYSFVTRISALDSA